MSAGLRVEDLEGGVRLLTLDRPSKRNAIDQALFDALLAAFAALDAEPDVRVAVLTGTDPAFSGGVDLADAGDPEVVAARRAGGVSPPTALLDVATPVLGAINGACVTGGLELALACDFLIASDRARFADTHVQLGVLPLWGASALLPEAVGVRRAKELALTGRFIDAEEALALGLVTRVVHHADLLPVTLDVARRIAAAEPQRVHHLLALHDGGSGRPREDRLRAERERVLASPVATDGMRRRHGELSGPSAANA
jgi:enoyl-CoA hydratase